MEIGRTIIGNRIPRNFFITKGYGESGVTQHAGSYHFALHDAGIEMCNIMTYSSILPKEANLVIQPEVITHGCVMESIMAVCHGGMDEICTAGIAYAWLYDKQEKIGGIVCEYAANDDEAHVIEKLTSAINELYRFNYSKYNMVEPFILTKSSVCKNKYGTALVAMCFVDYIIPVLGKSL